MRLLQLKKEGKQLNEQLSGDDMKGRVGFVLKDYNLLLCVKLLETGRKEGNTYEANI